MPVPPVALAVAVPVLLPHVVGVVPVTETETALAGWVIVTVVVPAQLPPSVAVTVYVPAANPVCDAPVKLPGIQL